MRTLIVVFITILVCCAFFLFRENWLRDEKKVIQKETVDVLYVGNKSSVVSVDLKGTVQAPQTVTISFEVSGKLEKGHIPLQPGAEVKKGQLVYQINNKEAFADLSGQKIRLSEKMVKLLPEIEKMFPAEKNKWVRFLEELKPQLLLPSMPSFSTSAERYFFAEKGVLSDFHGLQLAELRMTKYFYIVPFDGTLYGITEQPGNIVKAGKPVARIARTGDFLLQLTVPAEYIAAVRQQQKLNVFTENGVIMGSATLIEHQDKIPAGASVKYRFAFSPSGKERLFHGKQAVVKIAYTSPEKSFTIPASAVDGDLVQIVSGEKLVTRRITIAGRSGDSLVVTGLKDGEACVTHFVHRVDTGILYYPR